MEALERYLTDCENKRRRMRDRPSDAVLAELRDLFDMVEAARGALESVEVPPRSHTPAERTEPPPPSPAA